MRVYVLFYLGTLLIGVGQGGIAHGAPNYDLFFQEAGKRYRIDPLLLKAIALQESAMNAGAYNVNKNGTVDRGLMGINEIWMKELKVFGINPSNIYEPRINIFAGAWILKGYAIKYGEEKAVAFYNTGPGGRKAIGESYRESILKKWNRLKSRRLSFLGSAP